MSSFPTSTRARSGEALVAIRTLNARMKLVSAKFIRSRSGATSPNLATSSSVTGVPALVGHHRRHNPLMRAAREFLGAQAQVGQQVDRHALGDGAEFHVAAAEVGDLEPLARTLTARRSRIRRS